MSTQLRGGVVTEDPRLDRIQWFDEQSRNYRIRSTVQTFPKQRGYTWRRPDGVNLDQGQEGACVSTGWGHELAARPGVVRGVNMQWCRTQIYWEAQKIDPWSGGAYPGASPFYEGTAVLAGAKVVQRMGFIEEYLWAFTLDEVLYWLGYKGPVVVGFNWYEGMSNPGRDGMIAPTGRVRGGHCVEADQLDMRRGLIGGPNSWGTDWGDNGRWYMTVEDFDRLRLEDGEVCAAVGRKGGTVT